MILTYDSQTTTDNAAHSAFNEPLFVPKSQPLISLAVETRPWPKQLTKIPSRSHPFPPPPPQLTTKHPPDLLPHNTPNTAPFPQASSPEAMAFITAALPMRTRPMTGARFRMQETDTSISPLNADEKRPMKEIYPVVAGSKAPVCRCWQSGNFPLCDGSHNKFNKETGSHVGPLVISAKPKEE